MLTREELHLRAALFGAIRAFFKERGFLEVDTPIRLPTLLPEANIIPLGSGDHFLQPSPEMCMKRLLASGCSHIFQICSCFRKGERGRRHLEEFTMLEWYRVGADYRDLMRDCRELVFHCLQRLHAAADEFGTAIPSISPALSDRDWPRLSVAEAFARWSPLPLQECLQRDIFDEILVEHIEPRLGNQTCLFLYDYPAVMASLARKKAGYPEVAERFELYWQGVELANGFSELTDADEQRQRFVLELQAMETSFNSVRDMPEKFLTDLERLGECAGIAFGVDRFFMLALGKGTVGEAVTFSPADL